MKRNYLLIVGLTMLLFLVFIMIITPSVVNEERLVEERIQFEEGKILKAPFPPNTLNYKLGSDSDGRDLLSLILVGTKETLLIIFSITLLRYLIAVPLGLYASKKDGLSNWLVGGWNALFSSIPTLLAGIFLINMPFIIFAENRYTLVIIIIALLEVGRVSYIIQEQGYNTLQKEFTIASKVQGAKDSQLILQHVFPYLIPTIVIHFFMDLGRVTILVAQLGIFSIFVTQQFVQTGPLLSSMGPPFGFLENTGYNWATMLNGIKKEMHNAPWLVLVPVIAIMYITFMFNLIGEGAKKYFLRRDGHM